MVKAGNPLQIQFKQSPLQARILQTASSEFDELDYPYTILYKWFWGLI